MIKNLVFLFFIGFFVVSCKNKSKNNASEKDEPKNFFPIADYLKSEIHYVDSLPLGISKYTTHSDKTDTEYVKSPVFDKYAAEFVSDELDIENFQKNFSETSFMDATTHAATFTYSPKNNNTVLRRADVLATTSDGANKVSSIYLEKNFRSGDTIIEKKLLWQTRTSLQIATTKQVSNQPPIVESVKLVWGDE